MAALQRLQQAVDEVKRTAIAGSEGLGQSIRVVEPPLAHLPSRIWRRSSSDCSNGSSDSSSNSCSSQKNPSNNLSLPVALGVIIPIAIAVVLFVWLHHRHVKRLRQEDLNDPHKSLDFGWDPTSQAKMNARTKSRKDKKRPEMTVADLGTEKRLHDRGLSMDLDIGSPYVLPPGLHGSHESLHSMSRTIHSQDDRYRPATTYIPNDAASMRSATKQRSRTDDSSSLAASSTRRGPGDEMRQDLLSNAQRMSRSIPPIDRIPDVPEIRMPEAAKDVPRKALPSSPAVASNATLTLSAPSVDARDSYVAGDEGGLRRSNTYLGKFISRGNPESTQTTQPSSDQKASSTSEQSPPHKSQASVDKDLPSIPVSNLQSINRKSPPPAIDTEASQQSSRPPRTHSLHASQHPVIEQSFYEDSGDFGDGFTVQPPSPHESQEAPLDGNGHQAQSSENAANRDGLAVNEANGFGYDVRRLSVGVRPLPPDDPTDNPEQRANRIRSFYKEYFDDSKPAPTNGGYYEDYDENFLGEGATYFDPVSGQFITSAPNQPYAEPYGRRAMTPPPRGFNGGRRHAATMSGASTPRRPGPRAFSSASANFGPSGRGMPPKKKMPPPGPLREIPTPHLLKEDAFALPIDFAPPKSAKERQAGRPDSPRGGLRPYSPSLPSHSPLVSSYDDLALMPSPHLLRKSGTFTGLDFAPPPRIRGSDDGRSDDGRSIRSNRSAVSARHQHALRAGAYRVSRIPKEVVGTKNDLMDSLKPQWNMQHNDSRVGMDPKIGGAIVI